MKVMRADPAVAVLTPAMPSASARDRLAALYDTHEERLYRLARRLTADADGARDLVHDTFLRAAHALRSVPDGPAKEEAWLVRVLVNIRRDQWRKDAVRKRSAAMLRPPPAAVPTVEDALAAKRAVWAALDELHPRRRAIVVMHELEGMDLAAIARLLGLSVLTVRWNLSMGRRDLKRILGPHTGETT